MHNHTNMSNNHVIQITYPSPVDCDFCLTAVWTPTDRPVVSKLFIAPHFIIIRRVFGLSRWPRPPLPRKTQLNKRLLESIDLKIMERSISTDPLSSCFKKKTDINNKSLKNNKKKVIQSVEGLRKADNFGKVI